MGSTDENQLQISFLARWQMWLIIANLPIAGSQSFPELPPLAVYARTDKSNWNALIAFTFSSLIGPRKFVKKEIQNIVIFNFLYLLTDMVSKPGVFNQTHFNAKFVFFCYDEAGSGKDCRSCYYALVGKMTMQSPSNYLNNVWKPTETNNT